MPIIFTDKYGNRFKFEDNDDSRVEASGYYDGADDACFVSGSVVSIPVDFNVMLEDVVYAIRKALNEVAAAFVKKIAKIFEPWIKDAASDLAGARDSVHDFSAWRERAKFDEARRAVEAAARPVFAKTAYKRLARKVRFGRWAAPDRIE